MDNKRIFSAFFSMLMLALSSAVSAASQSANVTVTASVTNNCTIVASPVAFGAYDPVTANATLPLTSSAGSVAVTCTKGAAPTIGLGAGQNGMAAGVTRSMKGTGSDLLGYELYQAATTAAGASCSFPAATVWDGGSGVLTTAAAPSSAVRNYSICGSIPGGQDVAADANYSDIVIATVTF